MQRGGGEKEKHMPDFTSAAPLRKTSHSMSLSAASDVPWYRDIVSSGFLPKRCHSASAIENQSENTSLRENAIRRSSRAAILSSYNDAQRAKGGRHHAGSRRHQTNWIPGGARNTWPRKNNRTFGRLVLPLLLCEIGALETSEGWRQVDGWRAAMWMDLSSRASSRCANMSF